MPTMAYFTDFLASTAEISNLMSVLAVLGGLLVMFVFLLRLIYQVYEQEFSYIFNNLIMFIRTLLMVEGQG